MSRARGLLKQAQILSSFMSKVRRAIHEAPELGFHEFRTAELIRLELKEMGLDGVKVVAETGTMVDIERGSGPTIMLRADIDALPLQECTELPFASKNPGVMHACGHDAHTAIVLGATRMLKDADFLGRVRVLFQPSEERSESDSGGLTGAEKCIVDGVLDGVDAALALHQMPHLPCGTIGVTSGPVMAAAEFFEITVSGRSVHAGVNPEAGVDSVVVASELVTSLQTLVSRNTPASETAVVSVCTINGGTANNILAERVTLTGTIRAYSAQVHEALRSGIIKRCRLIGELHGATIEYRSPRGVPPTENNPYVTKVARAAAERIFSRENVLTNERSMGGEDFSLIAKKVPSVFALLGTQVEGHFHGLHSPKMILSEDAFPLGAAFLAETALSLLEAGRGSGK